MTIVSIHQPNYIPWLGYFKKIQDSDVFVFLDDVDFPKNGPVNRNKIRTKEGTMLLTIPIKYKFGNKIKEIKIDNTSKWNEKHKKGIFLNYKKANWFKQYWDELEKIYDEKYEYLIDINMKLINFVIKKLQIQTKIIFSSELNISSVKSQKILEICEAVNAETYISGVGGKDYLKVEDFASKDIKVKFQHFNHPKYNQAYKEFIPNIAAIDLILNEGPNANRILSRVENFS